MNNNIDSWLILGTDYFIWSINNLLFEKWSSLFAKVTPCFSVQTTVGNTHIFFYYHRWESKASNLDIQEARASNCLTFRLKKMTGTINWLLEYLYCKHNTTVSGVLLLTCPCWKDLTHIIHVCLTHTGWNSELHAPWSHQRHFIPGRKSTLEGTATESSNILCTDFWLEYSGENIYYYVYSPHKDQPQRWRVVPWMHPVLHDLRENSIPKHHQSDCQAARHHWPFS